MLFDSSHKTYFWKEHSMRRAFACENNSTERVISAGTPFFLLFWWPTNSLEDQNTLMTIMDVILNYKLESGASNLLIPVLGEKVTALLWDLFVWDDGTVFFFYVVNF